MDFIFQKGTDFKEWFAKLGFWKKLILIFTINTVIILVVMNVLMQILFGQVNTSISTISLSQTNQYISISNSLVGTSIANSLLTGLSIFSDLFVQVDSSLHFFKNRTDIYESLLSGAPNYNPPLTSSFNSTPNYQKTAAFVFSENSTFHDQPYIDVLMSSMLGSIQKQRLKRMNVIYQSQTNPSDIFAITIPGTNDFTIPSIQNINNRFINLAKDFVTITELYNDTFSLSSSQKLIALRTVEYFNGFRILMQTEIHQSTLTAFLSRVFYYPSTQIVVFRITGINPPSYQLINVDSFDMNLSDCFTNNANQYLLSNGSTLNVYSTAVNQTYAIGQSAYLIPDSQLLKMNNLIGTFRVVLLVDKLELSIPNSFMSDFLSNQKNTLSYIIYGWSFVILLATIGLSIVTGNYIFYNLKTLSEKLEEYTKSPSRIHKIIFELKELQCSGVIKKLIDNVVTVIQKIQQRKKNKNQAISPMIYPLNIAQKQFVAKNNLGDQQKWEQWKNMLIQAKQKMQKQKNSLPQKIIPIQKKNIFASKFHNKTQN